MVARSGFGNTRTGGSVDAESACPLRGSPAMCRHVCVLGLSHHICPFRWGCGYKTVNTEILWKRKIDVDGKFRFKAALTSLLRRLWEAVCRNVIRCHFKGFPPNFKRLIK